MESIEKLREWSRWLDCSYATDDGVEYRVYTTPQFDGMKSCGEYMREQCNAIEAEIAEKYMLLPVDADGVPIRAGDDLYYGNGKPFKASCIGYTETLVYIENNYNNAIFDPKDCRHVPRTVEDVLADIANSIAKKIDGNKHYWGAHDFVDEAAEIRELLGVSGGNHE